jgi:beta-phosphoglucomutase
MSFADSVGFIWDIDGVVVDSPHEEAWRITALKPEWGVQELSSDFYFMHVASRPRYEGANNILRMKGVYERLGAKTEEETEQVLERFCNQKNELIRKLIQEKKFNVFADAVNLIIVSKNEGVRQAAVSASKNARDMLEKIDAQTIAESKEIEIELFKKYDTLHSVFDVDACGLEFKVKEEMIGFTARKLREKTQGKLENYVLFEDAPMAMTAGKKLGMFSVGIQRIGSQESLWDAGADLVVSDLWEIPYPELKEKFSKKYPL